MYEKFRSNSQISAHQDMFGWFMKKTISYSVFFFGILIVSAPLLAYQAYISDTLEITMRTGPSTGHKIIAMLTSGQPVQVLGTENGWARIQVSDGEGKGKEGWVLSRFLLKRAPWKTQYEAMRAKNDFLKEKHGDIEQRWQEINQREADLTKQLEETTQSLETLQAKYEELKQGSANYLELKDQFGKTQSALEVAQKDVQKLSNENESLRYSQNIKWFATGALVPLLGWIVGILMGRRQKKSRPSLYR